MSKKPENPEAFPLISPDGETIFQTGMTLRDYFAGQAMIGFAYSAPRLPPEKVAEGSYALADAMLAERVKP